MVYKLLEGCDELFQDKYGFSLFCGKQYSPETKKIVYCDNCKIRIKQRIEDLKEITVYINNSVYSDIVSEYKNEIKELENA